MKLQEQVGQDEYRKRLQRMREVAFPETGEAVLSYLALIGDIYRLRERWFIQTLDPELDLATDFFSTVTPGMLDEALQEVCTRSPSEVAEQPDVSDVQALKTFVQDRDRLMSIHVALMALHQYRRWSADMLRMKQRFEHTLRAYDAWLETQCESSGLGVGDRFALLGERSVLCSSPRSV
jgi:hypothetical protein